MCGSVEGFGHRCTRELGQACAHRYNPSAVCLPDEPGALVACDMQQGCVRGHHDCAADGGASWGACKDDVYLRECTPWGQALELDCGALGGRCGESGCGNLPEGAPCGFGADCGESLGCRPTYEGVLEGECAPRECGQVTFVRQCLDEGTLAYRCTYWGAPDHRPCSMYGGTACVDGYCEWPEGASCVPGADFQRCPAGTACVDDGAGFACRTAPSDVGAVPDATVLPDGGAAPGAASTLDAGASEPDGPSCACSGSRRTPWRWAAVAAVFALLTRRRRTRTR